MVQLGFGGRSFYNLEATTEKAFLLVGTFGGVILWKTSVAEHSIWVHCGWEKYSSERGYFMHFNTTVGHPNETALLESRIFYPRRNTKCLQFFYKIDGSLKDKLIVWIKRDDGSGNIRKMAQLRSLSADGEQHWKFANIPFNSQAKFRYVFHGIKGDPSTSTGGINIDDISLTETQCPTGVWQIRNFTSALQNTAKGDYIASPVFFNSEGYCFVLSLSPHGPVNSSGSYLGIMFALCSAENDGGLEWPAGDRQVTFTIVDQNPDITQRMSASRSFVTDPNQIHNGKLLWDKPSITGSVDPLYGRYIGPFWGWNYILPHSELHRKSFLKDDTLMVFVNFEVVEDPGNGNTLQYPSHENPTDSTKRQKEGHKTPEDEPLRRNGVAFIVNKRVGKAVLGYNPQNDRMISVRIQGKPFNSTIVQVYAPTTGAEEAEVDRFCEGLQHLLELIPKNDVLIIMGDWNAKVGNQKKTGITGKFGRGVQNEAGHRLVEFCQENTMVIANTLFRQPERRLYTWTSTDS
ncbi:Meprin A subunit alpha [Varanus komodoensis]|nr:Meprin A subunit alpha [Varanus komodoensis]